MTTLKEKVLIAGGSGLIGQQLAKAIRNLGCEVRILTRTPKATYHYYWNLESGEIDHSALDGVTVLINLSGAGIADKRWTFARKKEIIESRIASNHFLFQQKNQMTDIKHFICASGINAYGYDSEKEHTEDDAYGDDFLSQLVKKWEESADLFSTLVPVAKIRTAVVLSTEGGALKKMAGPVRLGLGAIIGSGEQMFAWIHEKDLTGIYIHVMKKHLSGTYNAVGGCCTHQTFMNQLAYTLKKPIRLPHVPTVVIRLALGEMASMLLQGVNASNEKIKAKGYPFHFSRLEEALNDLLVSK